MSLSEPSLHEHWRRRAAEVRAMAAKAKDTEIKSNLLEIAKDYDLLAAMAGEREPEQE